jgi:hypothetical protein
MISILAMLAAFAGAQQSSLSRKGNSVSVDPIPLTSIARGKPGTVSIRFHVSPGFHVNSNTPKSEFLIPTALKLNPPTDIVIGKITYPEGREMAFAFSPEDKLSVYSGNFTLNVVVRPLGTVLPAKYAVHGQLRYQSCDNAACYPPKQLPVNFEIKVVKAKAESVHKNPAQSPHVHR